MGKESDPKKPDKKKLPRGVHRQGGGYRARIMRHGVPYHLGYFDTITDAANAYAIARADLARGTFVPPAEQRARAKAAQAQSVLDRRTVSELADAWLAWLARRGRKEGTIYTYRRRLEAHYLPSFGARPAATITGEETRAWASAAGADVARNVASMWTWAVGESRGQDKSTFDAWTRENPARGLDLPAQKRTTKRNERVATAEQLAALVDQMPDSERLIVLLAGWAGLRLGEVLALRRRHFAEKDTPTGTVWTVTVETQIQARGSGVREEAPKSAAAMRTIPVPAPVVPALEARLEQLAPDDLLFTRRDSTTMPHHPNTITKHFRDAVQAVDVATAKANAERKPGERVTLLENFTFHGLRHTALTRLGRHGATLADLMTFAGHSDLEAVRVYQHSEIDRLAVLAAKMGH